MSDGTETSIYIDTELRDKFILDYHKIDKWDFDENGEIIIADNEFNNAQMSFKKANDIYSIKNQ